jgi:hypothetical protein
MGSESARPREVLRALNFAGSVLSAIENVVGSTFPGNLALPMQHRDGSDFISFCDSAMAWSDVGIL